MLRRDSGTCRALCIHVRGAFIHSLFSLKALGSGPNPCVVTPGQRVHRKNEARMLGAEVVMTRWIALAVIVGLAAAMPCASAVQRMTKPDASAGIAVFDARRHARHDDIARHSASRDPRYYARPVYYRPYPYGVPAPFVLGFGPWW
ncbi:hypothetical protein BDS110ZK25_77320 [Bradyrhizobium diazoefficiens]|uniref:Uncharacterized protein n=3 Tax=Nitrobacteraceae TaxID=41294 RepID=A0A810BV48_9BRAD|nr:hypothetical protein BDHF08_04970 [Bradyrhizobium diazoefficiens]BCE44153.1 hypothetical protein XF4B_05020 [Bradyrhizobium diazoefficiens]BCE52986.1 hypothetical protein XF5B_04980 [Bradyrhizobium diazoefficiens]BCE61701.1 hypothetical protein XF6B_05000 [Bradyrhizobium diazoefficiens]BCE70451.1 hypothetical protein XF8B_05620 [Bradyrhizobium diazoefficiens]